MSINVKNTTFPGLLDLISPHSCRSCGRLGSVLCDCCKNYITCCNFYICPHCGKPFARSSKPLPTHQNRLCPDCTGEIPAYVVGVREGPLATLIHDYKYHSTRAIGKTLAELLDARLPENLPENTVLVPVPTSTAHIRARGFDHIAYLAKHLARRRGLPVEKVLIRAKNTVQVGADAKTRVKQASAAFAVDQPLDPSKTYLLLDDVWTTGASLSAASEKLRAAGAKHLILAVLALNSLDDIKN